MPIDFWGCLYLWGYVNDTYMSFPVLTLLLRICLGLELGGHMVRISSGSVINAKMLFKNFALFFYSHWLHLRIPISSH